MCWQDSSARPTPPSTTALLTGYIGGNIFSLLHVVLVVIAAAVDFGVAFLRPCGVHESLPRCAAFALCTIEGVGGGQPCCPRLERTRLVHTFACLASRARPGRGLTTFHTQML